MARRLNVSQRTAPHPRRATTQSSEYSLSRVSPCYASVRSVSPSVQVVPCRFLTYAAGRDCDRQSGGGGRGITCRLMRHGAWRALEGRDVTKTIAHWSLHTCQPSSMTFAVVVVPLPLLPARGWRFVDTSNVRQTIRASQLHRHVDACRASARADLFYRWHGTWSG